MSSGEQNTRIFQILFGFFLSCELLFQSMYLLPVVRQAYVSHSAKLACGRYRWMAVAMA